MSKKSLRLASFNVENMFSRPAAMSADQGDAVTRRAVLAAHARATQLLEQPAYDGATKAELVGLLSTLGVLASDQGRYVRLRKLRGQLLHRPMTGAITVVADGRADWIGWLELETVAVNEVATANTARVIQHLNADILTVIEAESRPTLQMFSASMLPAVGYDPYEEVMLVEGNDMRGIDVGFMARDDVSLLEIRTHVFDTDRSGQIFSRDCCEYHVRVGTGPRMAILVNHFKSKGYSEKGDPQGARKRRRQASRVAQIYRGLLSEGIDHIAVMGDLNDDPASSALKPLVGLPGFTDISAHPSFDWDHRRGTFGSGGAKDKIDYILLSPAMSSRVTAGGICRLGVWRGPRTKDPWDILPSLTSKEEEASDHAAIYADLSLA